MAAPKGHKKAGGRQAGTPNRATASAREAIAAFVEGNSERLSRLLDSIENGIEKDNGDGYIVYPNPKAAFDAIMSVAEYHLPKLARTEATLSGPDGGAIKTENTVKLDPSEAYLRMLESK